MTNVVLTSEPRIHICWSVGHYLGQVREIGHQKWRTVTGRRKTAESALAGAARKFRNQHRIRVLFIDHNPYYGPHVVLEGKRC